MIFRRLFKPRENKPVSIYQQGIDNLMVIDISKFARIHSPDYGIKLITAPCSNLVSLNIFLERVYNKIKDHYTINHHDRSNIAFKDVRLSDFFVDSKGYYINYEVELKKFIELSIGILTYLISVENNTDDVLGQSYIRQLHDVAVNISTSLSVDLNI